MKKDIKTPAWEMAALFASDQKNLQKLLLENWEPFAAIQQLVPTKTSDLEINKNNPYTAEIVLYLKRKVYYKASDKELLNKAIEEGLDPKELIKQNVKSKFTENLSPNITKLSSIKENE